MRFRTGWWGVILIADDGDDERLLRDLYERLPEKAESAYEDGKRRFEDDGDEVRLVFER